MILNSFNGGLNLRQALHLIQPNEGVVYFNIDNSKGHFCPMAHKRDITSQYPALTNIQDYGFYFDLGNEGYTTTTPQDWVVYKEQLYHADRVNRPRRRVSGGNFVQLGITAPNPAGVTLTGNGAEDTETPISYALTYYSTVTGAESAPALVGTINRHATDITLGVLPASADPQVDSLRIYRVGGAITTYTLVDTIADGTVSFVDNIPDDEVEGSLMESSGWLPAPVGAKYLIEYNAMLFAADGDQLRFTPIGRPWAWPADFYLDIPGTITGIGKTPIGLLVFTRYKTILVTGTGPTTLAQQNITNDQGCISHDSIVNIKGQAVWLSLQGICKSAGGIPEVVSKDKIGVLELSVTNALEFNEAYYIHFANTGMLGVFDFAFGEVYKRIDCGDTKSLVKVNDKLFALGQAKLWDMFSSTTKLTAKFKSGRLAEGGLMELKNQDRFRMAYTGSILIKLYVDGVEKFSKAYSTSKAVEVVEGKLPYDSTKNNFIEIELEGTGEVFEISVPQASANG